MSEEVKTSVQEVGEGWAVISFALPSNRQYVLQEVQSVRLEAKLVGLNVLYSLSKHNYSVDVDNELLASHGKEYLEAVMADAVHFVATTSTKRPIAALVNRREVAVIIDRTVERACIMPLHRFRSTLNAGNTKELDDWLAGTAPGYFVIPLEEFKK
jgi:hypothetical protein